MWKSVGPVGTNIVAYLFPIRKNRNSNTHWKLSRRTPPVFLVHQGYWKARNQLACRFRSPIKPSLSSSYSYSATTRTGLPRGKLTDLKNVNWEQWAGFSSLWHEYTPVLSTPLRHIYTLRIELLEIQSLTAANCYDFQEQDYHLLFYWSTLFRSRVLCPCNVKHTDQRYAFETYVNLSRKSVKKDVGKMSSLLLNSKKPVVQFEDKWHELKPTVNKLLKQQAVTTQEWQNLFW